MTAGRMLQHYELIEEIGRGGMGEVWRARDTRLGRDVAVKVLPDEFADDEDRLKRFEREAKTLAALNHPHVAQIYGVDQVEQTCFIVMELVGGESLDQRIERGGLSLDEALRVGRQVAEGLEAAHEVGIVHRDLKPANVALTGDGQVKVLDFGLAKSVGTEPDSGPTMVLQGDSFSLTQDGAVMGTPTYMSPEQARGRKTDRRTDIWAFGCVLFECLTGEKTFAGETVTDVLGAIVHKEPDWERLPAKTPPRVRELLRRCLTKDPRLRLRDIGEGRVALAEAIADPTSSAMLAAGLVPTEAPGRSAPTGRRLLGLAVAVVVTAALTAAGLEWAQPSPQAAPTRRFEIAVEDLSTQWGQAPAISRDGRRIVYLAGDRLWVRDLDSIEPHPLPGTEGALMPFWSPDSDHVGFRIGGKLQRAPASGGGQRSTITVVTESFTAAGDAAWLDDGRIVFSTGRAGDPLFSVSADGGDPTEVLQPDQGEVTYEDFHQLGPLPGARGVLLVLHTETGADAIGVHDGRSPEQPPRILVQHEGDMLMHPCWSPSGHLIYFRSTTNPGIWALPVAPSSLEPTGAPFLVAAENSAPSVSDEGTLVVVRGSDLGEGQLVWLDRQGGLIGTIGQPQPAMLLPELSPDERFVSVTAKEGEGRDVWIHDTERGTRTRLTFTDDEEEWLTVWTPDGNEVGFMTGVTQGDGWIVSADGTGEPQPLVDGAASSFTPDGSTILYFGVRPAGATGIDLLSRSREEGAEPQVLLETAADEGLPKLSPDGTLLAYQSDEGGREDVFLMRYPEGSGKWQVSVDGGDRPRWNGDGSELYYLEGDTTLMVVSVQTEPTLRLDTPRPLFAARTSGVDLDRGYDVSADGQRFVAVQSGAEQDATERSMLVVQNWLGEFSGRR